MAGGREERGEGVGRWNLSRESSHRSFNPTLLHVAIKNKMSETRRTTRAAQFLPADSPVCLFVCLFVSAFVGLLFGLARASPSSRRLVGRLIGLMDRDEGWKTTTITTTTTRAARLERRRWAGSVGNGSRNHFNRG